MARTFRDQIVADAQQAFLNTGEWAEEILHWPAGNHLDAVSRAAVVDWQDEQGQQHGDGGPLSDAKGRKGDHWATVELAIDVPVSQDDRFLLTHPVTGAVHVANVLRRTGHDDAMQAWLCVVVGGGESKAARVRK